MPLTLPDIDHSSNINTASWFEDVNSPSSPTTPKTPPRTPRTPISQMRPRTIPDDPVGQTEALQSSSPLQALLSTPTSPLLSQIFSVNTPPPPIPPKSPDRRSPSSPLYLRIQQRSSSNLTQLPMSSSSPYSISEVMLPTARSLSEDLAQTLDRWMVCIMMVQFDVEIGPDLKVIQPSIRFSDEDFRVICFSALPERSSNKETSGQFHSFRFMSTTFPDVELHGFALFSQQKTPSSSRGYNQESLVIISRLNYPQLFNACLQLLVQVASEPSTPSHPNDYYRPTLPLDISPTAKRSVDEKLPVITAAISDVAHWPNPDPNSTLELLFLGTIINLSIPLYESMPLLGTVELDTSSVNFHSRKSQQQKFSTASTSDLSLSLPSDAPVITASEPAANWDYLINYITDLTDLYILYEYMLLAKPIVIYANSPHQCSTFISLLVDLIRPIPYAGRVRGYVTIHSCPTNLDSGITGVTNPFLVRNLENKDALVFILSPTSGSAHNIATPFQYYRTFHNGMGILRRRSTFKASQRLPPTPHVAVSSQPKPVQQAEPLSSPSSSSSSWPRLFFFGNNNNSKTEKAKARISSPLVSTFVKLPNNLVPISPDLTAIANPISVKDTPPKHKRTRSNISEWENEQVNLEEETRIRNAMSKSKRAILKKRLLFPDQKFLASLARMVASNNIGNNLSSGAITNSSGDVAISSLSSVSMISSSSDGESAQLKHSIDFAIRFHFATLTAKFLSPLGCYLDPATTSRRALLSSTSTQKKKLEFSQNEFIHDLASSVSPNVTPRRHQSLRSLRRRSMIVSSSNSSGGGNSSVSGNTVSTKNNMAEPEERKRTPPPLKLLYPITSQEHRQQEQEAADAAAAAAAAEAASNTADITDSAPALAPVPPPRSRKPSTRSVNSADSTSRLGSRSSSVHSPPHRQRRSSTDNRRKSMLALSSLGIKFSSSTVPDASSSTPVDLAVVPRNQLPSSSLVNGTKNKSKSKKSNNNNTSNTNHTNNYSNSKSSKDNNTNNRRSSNRFSGLFSGPTTAAPTIITNNHYTTTTKSTSTGTKTNQDHLHNGKADSTLKGTTNNGTTSNGSNHRKSYQSNTHRHSMAAPITTTASGSSLNPTPSTTADLHKQLIYREFLGTNNFKNWLAMNDVGVKGL